MTNIGNLIFAIEKYFCGTANYAKREGYVFMDYMLCYHPTDYLYPVSQACDRLRQDIGIEGALLLI